MKTESHTPGPWSAINNGNHWNADITNWIVTYGHDGEQVVDHVYEEADAHLIASAPDLLAALVAQERVEALESEISDLWAQRSIEAAHGFVRPQTDERLTELRQQCNEAIEEAKDLRAAALLKAKGSK